MEKMIDEKMLEERLQKATEELCDNYCKYPEQWNKGRGDLSESEICRKCPLTKIITISAIYGMV